MKANILVIGLLVLTVAGCTKVGPNGEFVCYDDGKLVERHVGVDYIARAGEKQWQIVYADGQTAFYVQDAGETCQVEIVK